MDYQLCFLKSDPLAIALRVFLSFLLSVRLFVCLLTVSPSLILSLSVSLSL